MLLCKGKYFHITGHNFINKLTWETFKRIGQNKALKRPGGSLQELVQKLFEGYVLYIQAIKGGR